VLVGIVVGGTFILGGEGAIWRTVTTLGVILLLAVGGDAWSRLRTP